MRRQVYIRECKAAMYSEDRVIGVARLFFLWFLGIGLVLRQ